MVNNKTNKLFKGVIIPMVTPFTEKLHIDTASVGTILSSFIQCGVSPFLLGTTGESVSVTEAEKYLLVKTVVYHTNNNLKIYSGISGNSLYESTENAKKYADLGVDAVVAHLPFYYPLSTTQMLRYYEQMADMVPCPLILYNNPITTKYSVPLEVIEKLSYHPNIAGLKDSERGMERLEESIMLWRNRTDFSYFVGWAAQSAYALLKGADGIIPSTGNITPKIYRSLYDAAMAEDVQKAMELQTLTDKISEIYQKERNLSQSIPALKVLMNTYGLCKPHVMPPMYDLSVQDQEYIKETLAMVIANENL
jgi:dihydrodipicolinate synthase/N-acetylneuraminate lyase